MWMVSNKSNGRGFFANRPELTCLIQKFPGIENLPNLSEQDL